MEREAIARRLRRASVLLGAVLCCAVPMPSTAQGNTGQDGLESLDEYLLAVEVVLTDGTTRRGQALACATHREGVLLVSANNLLRLKQPGVRVRSLRVERRLPGEARDRTPASLLEFRDQRRNLGLLFMPGRLRGEPPTYGCEQMVQAGAGARVFRRNFQTGALEAFAGRFIRPFEQGRARVRMEVRPLEAEALLGAPVFLGETLVGLAVGIETEGEVPVLQVASIEGLVPLLAMHGILFSLRPRLGCLWERLPLQGEIVQLRSLVAERLVPGRSWAGIHRSFAPTDAELRWLFGPEAAPGIKAALERNIAESQGVYPGPALGRLDAVTLCVPLNQLVATQQLELPFKPRDTVACGVMLPDGSVLELFVRVDGRWVWVSSH